MTDFSKPGFYRTRSGRKAEVFGVRCGSVFGVIERLVFTAAYTACLWAVVLHNTHTPLSQRAHFRALPASQNVIDLRERDEIAELIVDLGISP